MEINGSTEGSGSIHGDPRFYRSADLRLRHEQPRRVSPDLDEVAERADLALALRLEARPSVWVLHVLGALQGYKAGKKSALSEGCCRVGRTVW